MFELVVQTADDSHSVTWSADASSRASVLSSSSEKSRLMTASERGAVTRPSPLGIRTVASAGESVTWLASAPLSVARSMPELFFGWKSFN